MALRNVVGGWLGARLALGRGHRLVRAVFLAVSTALILCFGWEVLSRCSNGGPLPFPAGTLEQTCS